MNIVLKKCVYVNIISPPVTLLTPAVEVPEQLAATTEYSYTVLTLSCVLSIVLLSFPVYTSVVLRYTEYLTIGISSSGINQLISKLEQVVSV